MLKLGQINTLVVKKAIAAGMILDGGEDDVLLPNRFVPDGLFVDDNIEVFVYTSAEGLVATTDIPKVFLHECAVLEVVDIGGAGAFLDWGLRNDLLVPHSQQLEPMEIGKSYCIYVYVDEKSGRITASSKLHRFLEEKDTGLKVNESVNLLVVHESELGVKAVINGKALGLIFRDDLHQTLIPGQRLEAYVKEIRPDGKINIGIGKTGNAGRMDLSGRIIEHLRENQGESNLCDKSPPEEIAAVFQVSKGAFKKALGSLYKKGLIEIKPTGIRLIR